MGQGTKEPIWSVGKLKRSTADEMVICTLTTLQDTSNYKGTSTCASQRKETRIWVIEQWDNRNSKELSAVAGDTKTKVLLTYSFGTRQIGINLKENTEGNKPSNTKVKMYLTYDVQNSITDGLRRVRDREREPYRRANRRSKQSATGSMFIFHYESELYRFTCESEICDFHCESEIWEFHCESSCPKILKYKAYFEDYIKTRTVYYLTSI
ncbi:hypothetical protein LXL04_013300 [Taraxacum kok-saghyz]